jgi:hypothetical protein
MLILHNQRRKYNSENNHLENISTCQNKMNLENKTKMACMGPPPSGASWKHYFSG